MPNPRVLVIDDERIVYENCKRILEEEGCKIKTALSRKEAFDKMEVDPFNEVTCYSKE